MQTFPLVTSKRSDNFLLADSLAIVETEQNFKTGEVPGHAPAPSGYSSVNDQRSGSSPDGDVTTVLVVPA